MTRNLPARQDLAGIISPGEERFAQERRRYAISVQQWSCYQEARALTMSDAFRAEMPNRIGAFR
ncbi:hypothetical protein LV28_16000 [Pandoraea pnomenusa]|uniref:Uncharacterized protein n=1 Tax=Pandoraea pnomenusa TaxID=93220 RepID=A0A378YQ69_9BURK|nr:hypothetical protein LV28_16000 [Pandoraea pnomenusa]ANC44977.1 hypothetical protein A6P55_13090 [Pandoraea pnomenusa]SUA79306.1 Uncharacterised protein [Pandoraea pnomenusa]